MPDALLDELRERVQPRSILVGIGVLAALHVIFDTSLAQLGVTAVTGAVFGLSEAVEDAYDLRSSIRGLAFAGVVTVSAGALLAFDGGPAWFSAALLVLAVWFMLDAVQTLRHGGLTEDDARDGEAVYHTYVVRRVYETLDERPRTRRELSDALDANDGDVDRALDTLRERGVLDRTGSELHLSSSERSRLGTVREKLGSGANRVLRPVTLELEKEKAKEKG